MTQYNRLSSTHGRKDAPTPEREMRKKYRNAKPLTDEERRTRAKYRIPIARND